MFNIIFLGILLCTTKSFALYESSSDVVELTPSNFDRLVTSSDEIWIVEFFAPWCGHCKNLVPEYQKVAKALKGIAKVGAVDADNHKSLGQKYGVTGFPTIKIFTGSKHTPYQGQRTAEAFVDGALKAAKDKAYESLGKKGGGSSDKKPVGIYGHDIPWKNIPRYRVHHTKGRKRANHNKRHKSQKENGILRTNEILEVVDGKQISHPDRFTKAYGKPSLDLLQVHLFRRALADSDPPVIVKQKKLPIKMEN